MSPNINLFLVLINSFKKLENIINNYVNFFCIFKMWNVPLKGHFYKLMYIIILIVYWEKYPNLISGKIRSKAHKY